MDTISPDTADAVFLRVLACHHDLFHRAGAGEAPLVTADFEHALDTWQWTRHLDPEASLAVQIAALFHDVERIESEARVRVEHRAASYDAFKQAHARRGAAIARECLSDLGVDEGVIHRVAHLVERHEQTSEDPEVALLNEADALSFFSLNSAGFVDYYGVSHARMKVARSLARLGDRGRRALSEISCRADVAVMIREAMGCDTV